MATRFSAGCRDVSATRRLLETGRRGGSPVSRGNSNMFDFFFPVSSRSRRCLRDVSIRCGDVADTNFVRDWGDVSETYWRPRRRRPRDFRANWLSPCLETSRTSPWRRLGEGASHFLVSRIGRVAATDPSRRRLRQ